MGIEDEDVGLVELGLSDGEDSSDSSGGCWVNEGFRKSL
jgi:hypothetical protein